MKALNEVRGVLQNSINKSHPFAQQAYNLSSTAYNALAGATFVPAHNAGEQAEIRYLQEQFPTVNITPRVQLVRQTVTASGRSLEVITFSNGGKSLKITSDPATSRVLSVTY